MRKLAAILLLLLLVFNWGGYRLFAVWMQHSVNRQLEARLDKGEYEDSQLIELKVPINLPYQTTWNSFERVNGEIVVNGQHYKYVKRKVHNDSLILLCLPNERTMLIENARDNFFRLVNDLQATTHGKGPVKGDKPVVKSGLSDYLLTYQSWNPVCPSRTNAVRLASVRILLPLPFREATEPPPDC